MWQHELRIEIIKIIKCVGSDVEILRINVVNGLTIVSNPVRQRRRDIPNSLTHLADKHANDLAEDMITDEEFTDVEKHQLTHREVEL